MFSARFGDEGILFRLVGQLEQVRPRKHRLPPVYA
jgi:amidase/6-aminohexanoate-cyclic-dimer hydrolase